MTGSIRRRDLLTGTALLLLGGSQARSRIISGELPWRPTEESRPEPVNPGPWSFFSPREVVVMSAIADRLIPPDSDTPGGKDAGCVVYIDRQLSGPYGRREGLYVAGPFEKGSKQQGPQSSLSPAELYRKSLAALDRQVKPAESDHGGTAAGFAELSVEQQDQLLQGLESGSVQLPDVEAQTFFEQLLKDVQQGFFADPIYGGNRDMCAWKMIGFPGARYDYRDWVGRHNERYPYPPVSIAGRSDWNPAKG